MLAIRSLSKDSHEHHPPSIRKTFYEKVNEIICICIRQFGLVLRHRLRAKRLRRHRRPLRYWNRNSSRHWHWHWHWHWNRHWHWNWNWNRHSSGNGWSDRHGARRRRRSDWHGHRQLSCCREHACFNKGAPCHGSVFFYWLAIPSFLKNPFSFVLLGKTPSLLPSDTCTRTSPLFLHIKR